MEFRSDNTNQPRRHRSVLSKATRTVLAVSMVLTGLATVVAQEPIANDDAAPTGEEIDPEADVLRAVVRVSWKMIDRLADDQIDADVPFQSEVMGGQMSGRVRSRADITIDIEERPDEARFKITAEGTARGNFNASRGRIRIGGPMSIPFVATKFVTFDGRRFIGGETTVVADVHIGLNCVGLRRNGPFGRLGARMVTPAVEREKPSMERSAQPLAEQHLNDFVDQEMNVLTAQLNQVSDLEASVLRVYPQLREWRIQLSSTRDHLEARYAPPNSDPVELPRDPRRPENAGMEIWVRTTPAEAKLLERIGGWDESQKLLRDYLEEQDVAVQEMSADAKVIAIDEWVVVAMGKAIENPVKEMDVAAE